MTTPVDYLYCTLCKLNMVLVIGCPCAPEKGPQAQTWKQLAKRKHLHWNHPVRHRYREGV